MDEKKRKALQAIAAAMIVSEYCASWGGCSEECAFATRDKDGVLLPCMLREIDVPEYWNSDHPGLLDAILKEVTQ